MKFKKVLSGLTSLALSLSAFAGMSSIPSVKNMETNAAQANWKFDFGGNGAANGYTGVSASEGYNASKGYGFAQTGNVSNVNASGSGAVADAVKFNNYGSGNTFNVDLPKGLYEVKVTVGNSPRTTIKMENMLQMMNLTNTGATETIQIPVTDGQLNIQAVEGMSGREQSIAAVEITQLNTTGEMKPTVWICGDSTVANYYNQPDNKQHGWGQYLKDYINTNVFEVRNMATSGQYAKGFYDGGQFAPIEYYGKAGDYFVISIGINDTNYSNASEYHEVVTTMVEKAKKKGMKVILVKQQGRHGDLSRKPLLGGRWFGGELDKIASEQKVDVVDLFTAWQNFGVSIGGFDAMTEYYGDGDDLHQSAKGAKKNAELVQGLMKIGNTEMKTDVFYTFKNTNSGLVMDIVDGKTEEGSNVQQWESNGLSCQQWELKPFNNGTTYYYVHSAADPNYVLKAMSGENGGNVEIVPYSSKDSMMLFQFTQIGDGSYYISTRSSRDVCFVEVDAASKNNGANVQQWGMTYNKCQNWQALTSPVTTASQPETTKPVETTAVPTEAPTEAPTEQPAATEPAETYLLGDANCNDKVEIADAVAILQYLANSQKYPLTAKGKVNADVFEIGSGITAMDALLIQKYDAGMENLPVYQAPEQPTTAPVVTTAEIQTTAAATTEADPFAGYYFAVDQTWDQGVIETTNEGFTRPDGYVNLDNNNTSSITFTVNAEKDGNYMTHIRFANGTDADRVMKVIVNDVADRLWKQSFTGTGSWTTWNEFGIVLPLSAGKNTIKFVSDTASGGPNLDYITITLTDEPYAETFDPNEANQNVDTSKPTIYIAGDSTVQTYRASYAPQQGWGYYLPDYFADNVSVSNQAIAGRSSKKFYDEGRWKTIADSLKKGDYVMIQFAINDAGTANADRYAPTCGNVNSPSAGSYEWYMTEFIKSAQAKGATPVLVTTVIGMKAYSGGKFVNSYTNYCDACKQLAKKYNVPCIDLNSIMVNHYNSIGYDTAKSYHLMGAVSGSTDGTHFCEKGAKVVAGLVAKAVKDQKIDGLAQFVK